MVFIDAGVHSIGFNGIIAEKDNNCYLVTNSSVLKVLPMYALYSQTKEGKKEKFIIDNGNYSGGFLCSLESDEGVLIRNITDKKFSNFCDFTERVSLGLVSTGFLDFLVNNKDVYLEFESQMNRSALNVDCIEQAYLRWLGLKLKDISYDFTVEYRGSLLGDLQSEVISINPNLRTENPDYSIEKGDLNSIDGYVDFITTSQEYGVVALVTVLSNSAFIKSDSLCYEFGDSGLVFDVNSVYANSDSNLGYGNKILFVLNKEESVVKEENGICVM